LTGFSGPGLPTGFLRGTMVAGYRKGSSRQNLLLSSIPQIPRGRGSWKRLEIRLNDSGRIVSALFCGITVCYRRMFGVIVTSTDEQRKIWLDEVKEIILGTFPHRPG